MVRAAILIVLMSLAGCSAAAPACDCEGLREQVTNLESRLQEHEWAIEMQNARLADVERYDPQELKELRFEEEGE